MKTKKILLLTLTLLLLNACVSATPYQKHGGRGGYSEQKYDDRNFVVMFNGNGYTDRKTASDFALLRSAEVSKSAGFNYFIITDSEDTTVHPQVYGQGLAGAIASSTVSLPVVTNSIFLYKEKPKNKENVYEADRVISELKAKYKIN